MRSWDLLVALVSKFGHMKRVLYQRKKRRESSKGTIPHNPILFQVVTIPIRYRLWMLSTPLFYERLLNYSLQKPVMKARKWETLLMAMRLPRIRQFRPKNGIVKRAGRRGNTPLTPKVKTDWLKYLEGTESRSGFTKSLLQGLI